MANLILGTRSFTTSSERDKFASLRTRYMEVGIKHRERCLARYSSCTSIDEIFERLPHDIDMALTETVKMAATDIAAYRVYDIDLATLNVEMLENVEQVRGGFAHVQQKYLDIIGKSAELEAQRKEAMENRGRVVGGGFGVEGAVRGVALATVANAAVGLTYGLANLTAKGASALGDRKKKRELLEEPTTRVELADFLCRIVLEGCKLVALTVNNSTDATAFDVVTEAAQRKAGALIENVTSDRVPETDCGFR
jgi:hypothetical protein